MQKHDPSDAPARSTRYYTQCPACDGTGSSGRPLATPNGWTDEACKLCEGTGLSATTWCHGCGTPLDPAEATLTIVCASGRELPYCAACAEDGASDYRRRVAREGTTHAHQ